MTIEARLRVDRENFRLQVDLAVAATGVTALLGPSGCGKTTVLRVIAGLERHPDTFLRVDESTWQDGALFVPPHRRPLGYVFQDPSLFPHLSVMKNLEYGQQRVPPAARNITLDQAIEWLGISHLLHRNPAGLSGGEQQRVAIARALAVSPRLLLMDEPLSALDREGRQEILGYIEALQQALRIPILYVSHSHEEVARLADDVILLEQGRVTAIGPVHQIFTRADLPLAHHTDAAAIVEAVVGGHDDDFQLTWLDAACGRFSVLKTPLKVGARVRLQLAAKDVSIALTHQAGTSILNIFPVTVDAVLDDGAAQVTVRLDAAGTPLLARITRKSAAQLQLAPGKAVYAQVKSVALLA